MLLSLLLTSLILICSLSGRESSTIYCSILFTTCLVSHTLLKCKSGSFGCVNWLFLLLVFLSGSSSSLLLLFLFLILGIISRWYGFSCLLLLALALLFSWFSLPTGTNVVEDGVKLSIF